MNYKKGMNGPVDRGAALIAAELREECRLSQRRPPPSPGENSRSDEREPCGKQTCLSCAAAEKLSEIAAAYREAMEMRSGASS